MGFLEQSIKHATGALQIIEQDCLQILWSGYGKILRFTLIDGTINQTSIIVKYIQLPNERHHPRGWNTDIAHQRKLTSYQVESNWYKNYNYQHDSHKIPKCFGVYQKDDERVIVLEDLDASGFDSRLTNVNDSQIKQVIKWLACFHVAHLIEDRNNYSDLWNIGTYWHLKTRPDELEVLTDITLKQAAVKIDRLLNECPVQTLVHGDAKLANFCFDLKNKNVAAVDFQYIGQGVGVKDLAYFLGSCLNDEQCELYVYQYVDYYFEQINEALKNSEKQNEQLETLWRELFELAWVDFQRFVKGWSPEHWKINHFSEQLTKRVIRKIHGT